MTFSLSHFPTLGVTFSLSLDIGRNKIHFAGAKKTFKPEGTHFSAEPRWLPNLRFIPAAGVPFFVRDTPRFLGILMI